MAKTSLLDWSATAASNTDIGGIDIGEGCPAANVNNGMRETMAQMLELVTLGPRWAQTLSALAKSEPKDIAKALLPFGGATST